MRRRLLRPSFLPFFIVLGLAQVTAGQAPGPDPDPSRFEDQIRALEADARQNPPPPGGILFTGSSSIRLWTTLREDFPDLPVVNRGFGGSQLPDVIAFADRIILPARPAQVVVYGGANDIAAGRSPAQVLADFKTLVGIIRAELPESRVAFISIAPNPARWDQVERVRAANAAVKAWATTARDVEFIDVFTHMLGPDGLPKPDLYVEDRLHMNDKGYALWRRLIGPYLEPVPARP